MKLCREIMGSFIFTLVRYFGGYYFAVPKYSSVRS